MFPPEKGRNRLSFASFSDCCNNLSFGSISSDFLISPCLMNLILNLYKEVIESSGKKVNGKLWISMKIKGNQKSITIDGPLFG